MSEHAHGSHTGGHETHGVAASQGHGTAPHGDGHGHAAPHVNYLLIFLALCVLTAISALADMVGGKGGQSHEAPAAATSHESTGHETGAHATEAHGEHVGPEHVEARLTGKQLAVILVVMAVAITKALFVLMYFMHVKFEGRWIWAMLLPTMVLALAIPAALMPDIGLHYYTIQTPQTEEYSRLMADQDHPDEGAKTPPGEMTPKDVNPDTGHPETGRPKSQTPNPKDHP